MKLRLDELRTPFTPNKAMAEVKALAREGNQSAINKLAGPAVLSTASRRRRPRRRKLRLRARP